jgi:hypothetical protein
MNNNALIVIVIVVVVIVALLAWSTTRRRSLRQRFGEEYEDALDAAGSRRLAETELRQRIRNHRKLTLTPLSAAAQAAYTERWQLIQAKFVDDPIASLTEADGVITEVAADRGYPTDDYEQQLAHLSVEHAAALADYRQAHALTVGDAPSTASTEDLRKALVQHRALFNDLLGTTTEAESVVDAEPIADAEPVANAEPADAEPVADAETVIVAEPVADAEPVVDAPVVVDDADSVATTVPTKRAPRTRKPVAETVVVPDADPVDADPVDADPDAAVDTTVPRKRAPRTRKPAV